MSLFGKIGRLAKKIVKVVRKVIEVVDIVDGALSGPNGNPTLKRREEP